MNPLSLVSKGRLNHNQQRFRDNGELRYSMRAFAEVRGVRRFHVVARGSPPSWLDTSHRRVRWWDEQVRPSTEPGTLHRLSLAVPLPLCRHPSLKLPGSIPRWWYEQELIAAFLTERNLTSQRRLLSANSEPSKLAVAALAGHLAERFLLLDGESAGPRIQSPQSLELWSIASAAPWRPS